MSWVRFLTDRVVKDGSGNVRRSFNKDEVVDLPEPSVRHWLNRGAAERCDGPSQEVHREQTFRDVAKNLKALAKQRDAQLAKASAQEDGVKPLATGEVHAEPVKVEDANLHYEEHEGELPSLAEDEQPSDAAVRRMSKQELVDYAGELNLDQDGTREQLIERILGARA